MIYNINGSEYPSVTTILDMLDKSSALINWALNCFEKKAIEMFPLKDTPIGYDTFKNLLTIAKHDYKNISEKALDVGTMLHGLIEKYIKHGKDATGNIPDEVQNGFIAFLEWEKENQVEWLASELIVCDEQIGYTGTLDAIARIKGEIYVIDFKSSKAIYDEYLLQLFAYFNAYNQNGKEATKCGILRLDKETGVPEWKSFDFDPIKFSAFVNLTEAYYRLKKRRLKNNPVIEKIYRKEVCVS